MYRIVTRANGSEGLLRYFSCIFPAADDEQPGHGGGVQKQWDIVCSSKSGLLWGGVLAFVDIFRSLLVIANGLFGICGKI